MNTKDVANKWAQMCREGQNLECVSELYAENVTSREIPGWPQELTTGKQNVWDKNKAWLDTVEEYHSGEISDPIIAGNHFSTKMNFDVTFKGQGRIQMEELAVFEVKNGKIVNEQFFYSMEH